MQILAKVRPDGKLIIRTGWMDVQCDPLLRAVKFSTGRKDIGNALDMT